MADVDRREVLALDREIRARWRDWMARTGHLATLDDRLELWNARAEALAARAERRLVRAPSGSVREREVPPDVAAQMREVAPQAILRDLHRPVTNYTVSQFTAVPLGLDRGGRQVVQEIHQALATRYEVPVDKLLDVSGTIAEDLGGLRKLLASPWPEAVPPKAEPPADGAAPAAAAQDQAIAKGQTEGGE